MKPFYAFAFATVAAAATVSTASAAVVTIDNFESYTNGQVIANSASSFPWRRFGAVEDQLYAQTRDAATGLMGAEIPIGIPDAGNAATVQYHYTAAQNLSSYTSANVTSRSRSTTPSTVNIQLSISNATTTYSSVVVQAESTTFKTFTFGIDTTNLLLASGTDSLATVLAATNFIGFRLTTSADVATTDTFETIAFDDFTISSTTASPEPASLGMLAVGGATLLRRRRTV